MKIKNSTLTILLTLYFSLVINIPFFAKVYKNIKDLDNISMIFIISIPVFLISIHLIIFNILTIKYITKPLFIILVLASAVFSYTTFYYGTVFDQDMITNFAQTDQREALSYFNKTSIIWFLGLGLLPALLLLFTKIQYLSFGREIIRKLIITIPPIITCFLIYNFLYQDYASVGRNNRGIHKILIPFPQIYSISGYINDEFIKTPLEFTSLGNDAKNTFVPQNNKNNLLVFVLGETARSQNMQLNGYHRETNKFTKSTDIISLTDVASCGTATAFSVPCMFSKQTRDDYSSEETKAQDNLVSIIKKSGTHQAWFENDGGCKGACDTIKHIEISTTKNNLCDGRYCFDEKLLENLKAEMQESEGKDTIIYLHIIGSHGPTYYLRYPEKFKQFTPECLTSDIRSCSQEEITNTYDNTLLYTDYVLSEIINIINKPNSSWNSSMFYVSDHGESLGESGYYLHGIPYFAAPIEQKRVPMMLWLSDDFATYNNIDKGCLEKNKNLEFSHDNIFSSVLGLMNITTKEYTPNLDIFAKCRNN